jgi:hypothetical protein
VHNAAEPTAVLLLKLEQSDASTGMWGNCGTVGFPSAVRLSLLPLAHAEALSEGYRVRRQHEAQSGKTREVGCMKLGAGSQFGESKVDNCTRLDIQQKSQSFARAMFKAKLFKLFPVALYGLCVNPQQETNLAE